ncbi:homeobox and leucine zipper protein Homez [Discoglossus pictus]
MSPITKDPGLCMGESLGLVCLPPIADDLQLIWTQAELTNELDDHPQLIHTFSYFPYPSMPEIALLCLRYGLQMEKVKTWFMVQRIRCGISWSSEEIEETRSRLLFNQDQLHFKPLIAIARKANGSKTPEKETISMPKNEAKEEVSAHPPCPSSGNAAPEAKRSRTDFVLSEKKTAWSDEECTKQHVTQSPSKACDSPGTNPHHSDLSFCTKPHQGLKYVGKLPVTGQMFGVDGTEVSSADACLPSEEELLKRGGNRSWNTDNYMTVQSQGYLDQSGGTLRGDDCYMPVMRRQRKTKEQLAILKSFFLTCQWATREDYKRLEEISGLPRSEIIQWFGDTRYALKHGQLKWFRDNAQGRPSWLDEPQHLVSQNGKPSELGSGESTGVGMPTSEARMPGSDTKTVVQPVRTSVSQAVLLTPVISSLLQVPVVETAKVSSKGTALPGSRNTNILDVRCATSLKKDAGHYTATTIENCLGPKDPLTNISESFDHVTPTRLKTVQVHISPSPIPATTPRVDYNVLERFWSTHRHIREEDLQSLITESGLDRHRILDWVCHKSSEPAEVEVCLDDDDEEEMEEEDYVVIQD